MDLLTHAMNSILSLISVIYINIYKTTPFSVSLSTALIFGPLATTARLTSMLSSHLALDERRRQLLVFAKVSSTLSWEMEHADAVGVSLDKTDTAAVSALDLASISIASDESIVGRSGSKRLMVYWHFFSSVHSKTLPSLAFLCLSLVSVNRTTFISDTSYGASLGLHPCVETATKGLPAEPRDASETPPPKRKRGRPKGSRNRNKTQVSAQ